jgi:DNA-directed RNA polymerase subunit beta'
MAETIYEKINDFAAVSIKLASPDVIRSKWSYGEVKKPETINYRTYRSEKDGLFCERIFGPEKDWECSCGKYKGIKHKGIICDKCGVMITHSRVRRERMGHINLAASVAHIWFFKSMPSRIGNLLGMKTSSLEKVIYFQDYVVIDPGDTPLKECQLLTEEEFREEREKHGASFTAGMGAEAVREILKRQDLDKVSLDLREELKNTRSNQKIKDLIKRLKTVEMLRDSPNQPEWMILDVIPVIPPDLRPLVLLDSGNFATSDLNDLYRRLINRNNRLKKLLDLNAPDVIIRNEKRMLQQSVDALFDNGRCRRPVLGSSNRPLKSLTDMIKGKQGRFRENLLGKRVDYSARSVIVVGPDLSLNQCGLPKVIALELYQPFIIRKLKEKGLADTIKSAKKMIERKEEEVWNILEGVIQGHPVLLNRAPTLHRMGIQAFEPVLVEGNAIRVHPLVCEGYNADFDGDQMAVHLPLSYEAQIEASTLVLATNNIFSPAHGGPIIAPSQDIVLGCFYLTFRFPEDKVEDATKRLMPSEAWVAYALGKLRTHEPVLIQFEEGREIRDEDGGSFVSDGTQLIETTVGRLIFNDILLEGMPFYNFSLHKRALSRIIADCHMILGRSATLELLDRIKALGFKASTRAGVSFGKSDLTVPPSREMIMKKTEGEVQEIWETYRRGEITDGERYSKVIDAWTRARDEVANELMGTLEQDCGQNPHGKTGALNGREPLYLNPIYCMVASKARGSVEQVRQLAGMRGLMARPSGKIIETPIRANFREGLKVLEYFSSTHGARKGLADTALKTADSGYLTRKLADVAQNVIVRTHDCKTPAGVMRGVEYHGDKVALNFVDSVRGRVSLTTIEDPMTGDIIVKQGELVTAEKAKQIHESCHFDELLVRSPLTCEADMGVCAKCYGMDLSRGRMVEVGQAVGIVAAQSIGEPGTQLTMRTFHIGGTASKTLEESEVHARRAGSVAFTSMRAVKNPAGQVISLDRKGEILIMDDKGRELERYLIPIGSGLLVKEGQKVKEGDSLCSWDPHFVPILAEVSGTVNFEDIVEGRTLKIEKDPGSKVLRKQIMEHKGEMHPQILITDKEGEVLEIHPLPERAYIEVKDGQKVHAGELLAKTSRIFGGVQDITGGLPRIAELFEARRPKEAAILAEIDGVIEFGERKRSKRTVIIKGEGSIEHEHLVPHGAHLRVRKGDVVEAGEPLTEGALVPQEILRISGEQAVQDYLLHEIQAVYRAQGVPIDNKHIEVILAQMMRKVQVEEPGDSELLPGAVIDKFRFRKENQSLISDKQRPASAAPLLLGVTKASLQSESFISAASFQETTKVLTEAALGGRRDDLVGLKENVILGHLVPTGTGFPQYQHRPVRKTIDLQAAAAELLAHKPSVDAGGPAIELEGS